MILGPITISWTKDLREAQVKAQRLDLRQNRCIVGLTHDKQRYEQIIAAMAARSQQRRKQGA